MYINKAFIYGNLTRDPELRNLPSGVPVASMGIATNRVYKDKDGNKQEDTQFHNVVVFGRQAETTSQYLKKGSGVFVEGRMQTRSWDAQDGTKKYRTEVVADRVQFGPKGGGGASTMSTTGSPTPEEAQVPPPTGDIAYPADSVDPDEIPF